MKSSCGKEEHLKELEVIARLDNLNKVMAFVDETLENEGCSLRVQMQIDVAVEEIFVNIAQYAYGQGEGNVTVRIDTESVPGQAAITFIDGGIPFDPLKVREPDVTLAADQREIGGLGIFMVRKSMDDVKYEYADKKNTLILKKKFK